MRDRVVQAAAKLVLEPIFEADFEECSFGFRPGRGQQEALEALAENARKGYRWVVDADIEQFFDTLDHQELMGALRRRIGDGEMLRLIYRWLKAGYLLDGQYHDTDAGSPQGGVLSPLLANVYLHAFDQGLLKQKGFIGKLTRYADDFVIQCGTSEQAHRALAWAKDQLGKGKLRLHPEKTRIVSDREEGFDFLGFHHRRVILGEYSRSRKGKESHGVLRWPSQKACRRFREQVRLRVGPPMRLRHHFREVLKELRLYLVGWLHYYRHGQGARVLRKLDRFVRERIARNLARSQPVTKGRRRRSWQECLSLRAMASLPTLQQLQRETFACYRGEANIRWRAV